MKHILIGLAGAAITERGEFLGTSRVGKDTLADEIVRRHGAVKLGFADPIRAFVASLAGCSQEYLQEHKTTPMKALCHRTPRVAMQTLGTEWGREMIGEDLWVNAAMIHAGRIERTSGSPVVFTDLRFPNEAEAIIEQGGIVIEVIRIMGASGAITYNVHPSERRLSSHYVTACAYSDAGRNWAIDFAAKLPEAYLKARGVPCTLDEE